MKSAPDKEHAMDTQHIETLIIGAGQAGLSTGYHLQRRGRPFAHRRHEARVGDNWRRHWDTLRLFTPAEYDGLPGLPFPAPAGTARTRTRSATSWNGTRCASTFRCVPAPGWNASRRGRTAGTSRRSATRRSAATTWSSPPAPSDARRTCPPSPPSSTPRSGSCTPASTGGPPSSNPGRSWWSAPRTPAGYRLRARRVPADDPCGPSRGNIPFRPESRRAPCSFLSPCSPSST